MTSTDLRKIEQICTYCNQVEQYLQDNQVTEALIKQDRTMQWTITTPLYNIGELVYRISKDFKDAHPGILWARISGLRHRLVHDYEDTNWEIICEVIFQDLVDLKEQLEKIIEENAREQTQEQETT